MPPPTRGPLKTYATIEGGSVKITDAVAPLDRRAHHRRHRPARVARGAIVIVDDGRKLGFHNWLLMPKAALLDPELTLGLPPGLTAATGNGRHRPLPGNLHGPGREPAPPDGIALDGLARGWAHIERATRDGQDPRGPLEHDERQHAGAPWPSRKAWAPCTRSATAWAA